MKRIIRYILIAIIAVSLLALLYLYIYTSFYVAAPPKIQPLSEETIIKSQDLRAYGSNWAQKVSDDLWLCYTVGNPEERGYAYGVLFRDEMAFQERALFNRMEEVIDGEAYRRFLCRVIKYYVSGMQNYLTEEQQREIYGLSLADTDSFNHIAEPYERQLSLHAAHDIGHAMQDYMLVGCSSFVLNEDKTEDSTLIFGRNFDFYCGEDFAKTKVVSVCRPYSGYAFISVSWGGMLGVVSGMNEKGLAICINASKLDLPKSVAMPISMLVRHLLIHCKNIEEARVEAERFKTFVAENIVVASAIDNDMAIIEKTPEITDIYCSADKNALFCTNHFQSPSFAKDERNIKNIKETDSQYRLELLQELVSKKEKHTANSAMSVLLNPYGKDGGRIGMGNELAINQLIAHHSVVFEPDKLNMYVCTSPRDFSPYIKFNLAEILDSGKVQFEYINVADSLSEEVMNDLSSAKKYREARDIALEHLAKNDIGKSIADTLAKSLMCNENFFEAWDISGDIYAKIGETEIACKHWRKALDCKIPKLAQRRTIEKKIRKYE